MASTRQAMLDWLSVIHLFGSRLLLADFLRVDKVAWQLMRRGYEDKEPVAPLNIGVTAMLDIFESWREF